MICSLLQLLSTSLNQVEEETWAIKLGEAFGEQLPLYKNYPSEKVIPII